MLAELGRHPGDGAPVRIKTGHYGPFVAYRRRYVSLPKDLAPEDATLEDAVALLGRKDAGKDERADCAGFDRILPIPGRARPAARRQRAPDREGSRGAAAGPRAVSAIDDGPIPNYRPGSSTQAA